MKQVVEFIRATIGMQRWWVITIELCVIGFIATLAFTILITLGWLIAFGFWELVSILNTTY